MKEKETNIEVENKNIKKLAIDLGASSIKIAGIVGSKIKLEKIKSLATGYGKDTKNTVILDGNKYHFGIGESLIVRDKTKRRLLPESILLSYYKIYGKTKKQGQDIDVAIGVPINIYLADTKKAKFEEELEEFKNLLIDGIVNGEVVVLKINNIKVYAEGYSAFATIENEILKDNNATLIDIGYKTTDVIALDILNNEWEITNNFTIEKGIWDIFSEIKKMLFEEGIELSQEQIEQRLLNAPIISVGNNKVNIKNKLLDGLPIVDYIYNQIDLQIQGLSTSNIYLIGGGAVYFNLIIDGKYPNIIVIDDIDKLVYANAIGYLQQLDMES